MEESHSNHSRHFEKLRQLADQNPTEAINQARRLEGDLNSQSARAAILIDAGSLLNDCTAINEGIALNRTLLARLPDNDFLKYNLANGLHALAKSTSRAGHQWHASTHDIRREARQLFHAVGTNTAADRRLRGKTLNNLANLLLSSNRWVEAHDAYLEALAIDSRNGVAAAGAAKLLKYCVELNIGDSEILSHASSVYAERARQCQQEISQYAGQKAVEQILKELEAISAPQHIEATSETASSTKYQQFVSAYRLVLSLTVEGSELIGKRWDSLNIYSLTEHHKSGHGIPPLFAMFNVMKADYLSARWLAYTALHQTPPDTGDYSDTLDYAVYGIKPSLILFAQRAAVDVLDKIAVAIADYLSLSNPKHVNFREVWFKPNKKRRITALKPEIVLSIQNNNLAVVALTEMAQDMKDDAGYLRKKTAIRNASTHRFAILHDIGIGYSRTNACIEHHKMEDVVTELLQTLRLARASLIYFIELIARQETQKISPHHVYGHLHVPSHHYIRGKK